MEALAALQVPAALLLKDKQGDKISPLMGGVVHRTSITNVLRGSLLTPLPRDKQVPRQDGDFPHNYQTMYEEKTVTVFSEEDDVAPLSGYEHLLMACIQSLEARYQTFVATNKLDWGVQLKCGDHVYVSIPGQHAAETMATQRAAAVIRYVGGVKPLNGLTFGVEIVDPHYFGQGTTDGTFHNDRYFHCKDNNGLFVSLDKLSQAPTGNPLPGSTPRGQQHARDPHANWQGDGKAGPDPLPSRLKEGDRVVLFRKDGGTIHGTVRWSGEYYDREKRPFPAVGIETDVRVFSSELESHLPPRRQAFAVGRNKGQVFVREDEVMLEVDYAQPQKPQPSHLKPKPHYDQRPRQPPENQSEALERDVLAHQMGVGHTQLMAEQSEALQQAAGRKKDKEMEKLRQVLPPGVSLRVDEQEQILRQISQERNQEAAAARGGTDNHPQPRRVEHEYDVISGSLPSQRRNNRPQHSQDPAVHSGYPPVTHPEQNRPRDPAVYRGYPPANQHPGSSPPLPAHPHPPPHEQPQSEPHNLAYLNLPGAPPPAGLEEGSPVQLVQDPGRTGVIKWMGYLHGIQGAIAGVELDGPMDGCGDGEWRGQRYFTCLPGRGFFFPAATLRPDVRIPPSSYPNQAGPLRNPLQVPDWEVQDQAIDGDQILRYLGDMRGIQGHQNSCYLDATIFGLFALSDVFDSLFLDSDVYKSVRDPQAAVNDTPATQVQREVSNMLWRGIVNPLRKHGAVRFESVMRLRNQLDELGKMEGIKTAELEKDPEEFLNMLFKLTLNVEPFIHIKRPFGTEPEFFVQLFVEFDETLKTPTVEILLQRMFTEQQISFANVPSKLLVQVPRYGKQFKTFKRIISGLKFNPAPLMDCPYTCHMCGGPAWNKCSSCGKGGNIFFCDTCSERVHGHKARRDHTPEKCGHIEGGELELLSVLCIETSHYVCFTRDPEGRWLFFDSMANRLYDQYNIPRGVDCTAQLSEWVYGGSTERLMAAGPRDLPELVRRFTQDVYMCVYIQPDYGMYGDSGYTTLASSDSQPMPSDQLLSTESHREQELKKEVKQLQDRLAAQSLEAETREQKLRQEKETLREEQHRQTEEMQSEHQQHIDRLTQQMTQQQDRLQQMTQQQVRENQQLRLQLGQEQERSRQLQERLSTSASETEQVRPATRLLMDVQFKTVSRNEVMIEGQIGRGAWGVVAKGKVGHQSVAVKWPHPDLLKQFPNIVNRLHREVAIMAQVRHPNLVRFIAAVFDEAAEQLRESPMIITELLDTNLRSAYQEGRVQRTDYLTILRDIAYALHYLHGLQQPIIHRDISSPNVLLQAQPKGGWLAKVSDFGSANLAKLSQTPGEGAIIYTAPEAFPHTNPHTQPPPMTTKIDVFSYGILTCEVITCQPPYPSNYRAMLRQVKGQWGAMYSLIVSCTDPDPLKRPTMADVLDKLPRPSRPHTQ